MIKSKDEKGFCIGAPKDCVVQPGIEFCYCDKKCVIEDRTCCEDLGSQKLNNSRTMFIVLFAFTLDFPKNCSMIDESKDTYGFCKGGPSNCTAKPDGEDYCFCDLECINNDTRKCCNDIGMFEIRYIETNFMMKFCCSFEQEAAIVVVLRIIKTKNYYKYVDNLKYTQQQVICSALLVAIM